MGQAAPEWVALVVVVALLLGGLLAAGVRVPGAALARSVLARIVCAVSLGDACAGPGSLAAAYGEDLARLVRRHAPKHRLRGGHARPAGRLPSLPPARLRRRRRGGHRRRLVPEAARRRLRPRRRLPRGRSPGDGRLLRRARRKPLPPVFLLLPRQRHPPRRPPRRRPRLPPPRLGVPAGADRAGRG